MDNVISYESGSDGRLEVTAWGRDYFGAQRQPSTVFMTATEVLELAEKLRLEALAMITAVRFRRHVTCGYCTERAIWWTEWPTIGRPKGAPMCEAHEIEASRRDNFNRPGLSVTEQMTPGTWV